MIFLRKLNVSYRVIFFAVSAFFLITISCSYLPAQSQEYSTQEPADPSERESWLQWKILSTLKNCLIPGYIPPQWEADVQQWLGEVKNYQSEFTDANQHVVQMDRATRIRDVQTENAEAKAAADILNRIKWTPYIPDQNQAAANSNLLQASASASDNSIMAAVRDALNPMNLQGLATQIGSQIVPIASALDLANTFKEVFQFTKAYTTNTAAQQRMTQFFGQPSNQVLSQLASAEANHLINERPDLLVTGLQHGVRTIRNGGTRLTRVTESGGNTDSSTNPLAVGGGGTKAPPVSGGTQLTTGGGNKTPPGGGGTQLTTGGAGNKAPPVNGGNKPPAGGGGGGNESPPGGGGGGKKPPSNPGGGGGDDEEPPGNRNNLAKLGKTTQESVQIKLESYLLNADHRKPDGTLTGKATWFKDNLGFTKDNMSQLAKQIEFDPQTAVATSTTMWGNKYKQVITILGANGQVRDVPFIFQRYEDGVVRLVTASDFPGKPKK